MIPECWPKTRRSGVHAATILPYLIFFFGGERVLVMLLGKKGHGRDGKR